MFKRVLGILVLARASSSPRNGGGSGTRTARGIDGSRHRRRRVHSSKTVNSTPRSIVNALLE